MDDLDVDLNRDGPHAIDVAPSFRAGGSFDVVLENHGAALHVHLHLDDDLSRAADLSTANHYVEEGAVRRVPVTVSDGALPVEGRLEIVTGYGSETQYVSITIKEPDGSPSVAVDEALGKPQPTRDEPLVRADQLPLIALGAVALLIALVAAAFIGDAVVLLGVVVVLIGLGVAAVLVTR